MSMRTIEIDGAQWRQRAILATWNDQAQDWSKLGHLLMCVIGKEQGICAPRFDGSATVTSDGFVLCNFVGRDGRYHGNAMVGTMVDIVNNFRGLADHLKLSDADRVELFKLLRNWIKTDYRSEKTKEEHEKLLTGKMI